MHFLLSLFFLTFSAPEETDTHPRKAPFPIPVAPKPPGLLSTWPECVTFTPDSMSDSRQSGWMSCAVLHQVYAGSHIFLGDSLVKQETHKHVWMEVCMCHNSGIPGIMEPYREVSNKRSDSKCQVNKGQTWEGGWQSTGEAGLKSREFWYISVSFQWLRWAHDIRPCYYPQFTDVETEAQWLQVASQLLLITIKHYKKLTGREMEGPLLLWCICHSLLSVTMGNSETQGCNHKLVEIRVPVSKVTSSGTPMGLLEQRTPSHLSREEERWTFWPYQWYCWRISLCSHTERCTKHTQTSKDSSVIWWLSTTWLAHLNPEPFLFDFLETKLLRK